MDITQILVILAGSSVLSTILTALVNGFFGVGKGRAETDGMRGKTSQYFDELAGKWTQRFEDANKRLETRIDELEEIVVELIGSIDRATPTLEKLAHLAGPEEEAVVIDLRRASLKARRAV